MQDKKFEENSDEIQKMKQYIQNLLDRQKDLNDGQNAKIKSLQAEIDQLRKNSTSVKPINGEVTNGENHAKISDNGTKS